MSKLKIEQRVPICLFDDCDEVARTRHLCSKHYQALRKLGRHLDYPLMQPGRSPEVYTKKKKRCSVEGCENQGGFKFGRCNRHREDLEKCAFNPCENRQASKNDPLCISHRNQVRKGKELAPLKKFNWIHPDVCQVVDCDRPYSSNGLCSRHDAAQRKGTPLSRKFFGDYDYALTVQGVHSRVRTLWGKASDHPCIECGREARDWAYDGTDPSQILTAVKSKRHYDQAARESFIYYSLYPEFYMPMCRRCHRRRDAGFAARELYEYRAWKSRTGLTLEDVVTVRPLQAVA